MNLKVVVFRIRLATQTPISVPIRVHFTFIEGEVIAVSVYDEILIEQRGNRGLVSITTLDVREDVTNKTYCILREELFIRKRNI